MQVSMPRLSALALASLVFSLTAGLSPRAGLAAEAAVHHLVLFRFREDIDELHLTRILDTFQELPRSIPGITGFQWGINNSPEGLEDGFTHGFIVTFENATRRDEYLKHPAHDAFVELIKPGIADVFVNDFSVEEALPPAEPGRVHHLVFFKYKEGTTAEQIDEVRHAFGELPAKISGLTGYQAGVNNSPEKLSRGFDHAFLLTFANERARDDYLPHPAHKAFGTVVRKVLEKPLVLDFTVAPSTQRLFVTDGLEPFRVYQRGEDDTATVRFSGYARDAGPIEARLRKGRRTVPGQDWRVVGKASKGRFEAELSAVPVGGEYTVEVRQRDHLGNVASHTEVADILVGDIWILAGQSNMEGVGNLEDVEPPSPLVHNFTMGHRWESAEEPLHWLVDSPDPVHSGRWMRKAQDETARRGVRARVRATRKKGAGLGLPFAKFLTERTGVPIGLISAAHGGTSMEQWSPEKKAEGGASLYGSMFKQVRNAGGNVRGVLWYQGESDANPGAADRFSERFKALVAAFRADLESPEMPFYYVQIGRFVRKSDPVGWDRIQELQRLAEKDIENCYGISVVDLSLDDLIHVGTQGLKRAGRRLGRIALREVFGDESMEIGPRVQSARAEVGGRRVRIEYAQVNGRLNPRAADREKVEGFSIRNAAGEDLYLIYKSRVEGDKSVVLELQQPLPEGAVLWYGAGLDPVCNLVDAADQAAMAFGPMSIQR